MIIITRKMRRTRKRKKKAYRIGAVRANAIKKKRKGDE